MSENCINSTFEVNKSSPARLEDDDNDDYFFSKEKVLTLIELYKKYKLKVSTGEIKSLKKMWEKISFDLSNKYKVTMIPAKCENKFKVLERAYKKVKDNNSRSGRGRKDFLYEGEFDEIFGKRININPKILLSSSEELMHKSIVDSKCLPSTSIAVECVSESILEECEAHVSTQNVLAIPEVIQETPQKKKRPTKSYTKRNDILIEMKNDFKAYYVEKLQIEREKLEEKKKRTLLLEKIYLKQHSTASST